MHNKYLQFGVTTIKIHKRQKVTDTWWSEGSPVKIHKVHWPKWSTIDVGVKSFGYKHVLDDNHHCELQDWFFLKLEVTFLE